MTSTSSGRIAANAARASDSVATSVRIAVPSSNSTDAARVEGARQLARRSRHATGRTRTSDVGPSSGSTAGTAGRRRRRQPRPRRADAARDRDEVAEHRAARRRAAGARTGDRIVPSGSASISMRLVTPSVQPNGLSAGTAVGMTAASMSSPRRLADGEQLDGQPERRGALDLLVGHARDARRGPCPRTVGGRRPTLSGSSQRPNASRARITSLLTASSPSTSPDGSASA